jgi:hypothetical protein
MISMLVAISLQLLGTWSDLPRTEAAVILLRRVTDTPASVNAALFLKLAYSSGSVYVRRLRLVHSP